MKKLTYILGIISIFTLAFMVIQPVTTGIDYAQSAEDFHNLHLEPVLDITIEYYEPGLKALGEASFSIHFSSMKPLKQSETIDAAEINHKSRDFMGESPSNYLRDYDEMEVQQVEHWHDGSITYRTVDKSKLEASQEGYRYEGWFPSPQQMGELIAWQNGWQLTRVSDASRRYIAKEGNDVVDIIFEQTLEDISVATDFEHMSKETPLTVTQQLGGNLNFLKLGLPDNFQHDKGIKFTQPLTIEPKANNITQKEPVTAIIATIALIVIAFMTWLVCHTMVLLDTTPYGQDDLARVYDEGYMLGVNESHENYKDRLRDLLYNGDISNETYVLLSSELEDNYDQTVAEFTNPYDVETAATSWIKTIITVIQFVIIAAIVIIGIIIFLWIFRKLKPKKKTDSSGTLKIEMGSSKQTLLIDLKLFFLSALSVGVI